MTNFQADAPARFSREQVLLWGPALLGALLAAAATGALLWPVLRQLQAAQQQLADLQDQTTRLPLLRQQMVQVSTNLEQARQRQQRILNLIAGSGAINTFMAQLGQEAARSGVQLDGYEPVTAAAPAPAAAPAGAPPPAAPPPGQPPGQPPAAPSDPLLAPGLQKTSLLITARGSGPQLQQFLRRLERLSLLVVQSDLALKHEAPESQSGKAAPPPLTSLRLNLSLYTPAAKPR